MNWKDIDTSHLTSLTVVESGCIVIEELNVENVNISDSSKMAEEIRMQLSQKVAHKIRQKIVEDKTPEESEAKESTESAQILRTKALRTYLMQLEKLVDSRFFASFNNLIDAILANDTIKKWLLKTNSNQFKDYNKTRVFRIAGMLKILHVLDYKSDIDLNAILEGDNKDTSYRKSMSHKDEDCDKISAILSSILVNLPPK